MAKKLDDSLFEDVPYEVPEMDDSLFEDVPYSESEEMSTLEAMARGAAQGLTFDFADEIMGASQAGIGALQGEGDYSELYKKYRDAQRKQMEQAAEESPIAYYGSDIAAGIIPALFTGGATAAATIGKQGLKAGAKQALKVGAGMGLATGAGASKADLTEGEIGDFAKDTAIGGILGAGLGAATPAMAKVGGKVLGKGKELAGKVAELVPGSEAIKIARQAGKRGIGITQEAMIEEGLRVAEKFNKKVMKVLSESGVERDRAVKLAEEAGVRIQAGQVVDDILEEIAEKGSTNLDLNARAKLYKKISSLKEGFTKDDQYKKLESLLAKKAAVDKLKMGAEIETVIQKEMPYDDIVPMSDQQGIVRGLQARQRIPGTDIETQRIVVSGMDDPIIKRIEFDMDNMTPSELQRAIETVNDNLVGDLSKKAATAEERYGRQLASRLREKLDENIKEFADPTGAMSYSFKGGGKLGMPEIGRGTETAINDNIDAIAKKLLSTGNASEIDKKRAFNYFKKASPEYADILDEAQFISKLNDKLGGMVDGVKTTSFRGLLGTAEGAVAKVANIAGKVERKLDPFTKATKGVVNSIMNIPEDTIAAASIRMQRSEKEAVKAMGRQLANAIEQGGPMKNAMVWSLTQQPAFRKEFQKAVGYVDSQSSEKLGYERTFLDEELFPSPDGPNTPEVPEDSLLVLPPEMEEEETEEGAGRSPASVETKDGNKFIEELKERIRKEEGKASIHKKFTEYTGLKGKKNTRVKGSSDYGLYYDSRGKLTGLYGKLITSDQEAHTYLDATKEDAERNLDIDVKKHLKETEKVLDRYNIDKNKLSQDQLLALAEMGYQLGPSKMAKFKKTLNYIKEGDYNKASEEAKDSDWYKQTPKRVENFQKNIIKNQTSRGPASTSFEEDSVLDEEVFRLKELQEAFKKLQKDLSAHSKYINSGGSAMYSSTGDRLIGSIEDMPISEQEKDVAKQAVLDGDIGHLRDMLDRYNMLLSEQDRMA